VHQLVVKGFQPAFHISAVENKDPTHALYTAATYHIRAFSSFAEKNNILAYPFTLQFCRLPYYAFYNSAVKNNCLSCS